MVAIRVLAAASLSLGACAFEPTSVDPVGVDAALVSPSSDGATVSGPAAFGSPSALAALNSALSEDDPSLTGDQLEIFFERQGDLYTAWRRAIEQPFGSPVLVAELSSWSLETTPEISGDGRTIYFASDRAGSGGTDIYVATRPARGATWSAPVLVAALSSTAVDSSPASANGWMILTSDRLGTIDLFQSWSSAEGWWSTPEPLEGIPVTGREMDGVCDPSRTLLYFSADWSGGLDLYVSQREREDLPWGAPIVLAGIDSTARDGDPWISADLHTLYFSSDRDGSSDLFVASR